jgi:hypothetical protein
LFQEELVRSAAFRYISDAITREGALAMLKANEAGKKEREAKVVELGYIFVSCSFVLVVLIPRILRYPAYVTSAGWLGDLVPFLLLLFTHSRFQQGILTRKSHVSLRRLSLPASTTSR